MPPPPVSVAPAPSGAAALTPEPAIAATEKPPMAAITPEEHARREIQQLLKNYCAAMETLRPEPLQKLYPKVDVALHREVFRQYRSLKCALNGPPEFDRLDASPAGGAQLRVGMRQEIQTRTGGAPRVLETIATIVISRASSDSPWLIDRVEVTPKRK